MATPENPQLPNAAELTPEQIAEGIAQQQIGGEPSLDQRGYVYQNETGSVFKGRTKEEVIDTMLKSSDNANKTIKQQRDELAQIKAQLEQQQPYIEPQAPPQQPEAFDPNRYYQMWAQNPNLAEDYRLQTTFGLTQQEMANQIYESYRFTKQVEPELVARAWMSQSPTFPSWEENPQEVDKAATAIQTLWNEFYPNDSTITPQRLEQVHAVALMRGMYQARGSAPVVEASAQSTPMPTLNVGTSGSGTGQQQEIAQMTPEQLRQFIEQNYR